MSLDEKTISEIAAQLGMRPNKRETIATVKELEKKNDDELIAEIMKAKDQLLGSNIPKEKQLAALESLMPLMNGQQKARLAKLIELMK